MLGIDSSAALTEFIKPEGLLHETITRVAQSQNVATLTPRIQDAIEKSAGTGKVKRLAGEVVVQMKVVDNAFQIAKSLVAFATYGGDDHVNQNLWSASGSKLSVRRFVRNPNGVSSGKVISHAEAVRDVKLEREITSGNRYEVECLTAIDLVLANAMADHYGTELFDFAFSKKVFFTNFDYDERHPEFEGIMTIDDGPQSMERLIPGGHYYFRIPEPKDPASQGQNFIYLGKNDKGVRLFYAHGLGARVDNILTEKELMKTLRGFRKRGSTEEPELINSCRFLDVGKMNRRMAQLKTEMAAQGSK